jgi:iron complex outermembrane recepter protein
VLLRPCDALGGPEDRPGERAQASGDVTPPTVVQHVDALYPSSALAARKHATVLLRVTVDADGHVTNVEVVTSGGQDLDEAATIAARQWVFEPAKRRGVPVASRISIPFHFAPPAPPPEIVEPKPPADELPPYPAAQAAAPSPVTPAGAAANAPAAAGSVDEVLVRGRVETRAHGASDYQVTVGELKAVPRANASDALKLAPGFLLTNEGGSGHAEQVFLRGFDAHEGQDIEFTVDGVPINDAGNYHGNGYADTHFILSELIQSVRVLEGPYAPQQGNFAVAGSADYHLGLDRRGVTAEYATGSFDMQRLLLTWGPRDGPQGTFIAGEYYTTDGFGVNRQARRGTGIGQYEFPVGANGVMRLNATVYATEFNQAGVVREDAVNAGLVDFYGTMDPNQTGNTATRGSVAATYEARFENTDALLQLALINRTMRLREDWTGFLLDTQEPMQSLHDQRGDMIDLHFDETTLAARGLARWHGQALGMRQEAEIGYVGRLDLTSSTQYRIAYATQAPYKTDADLTSTLGDVGVYVDGNVHALPWVTLRGGVRADLFLFDVLNNCALQGGSSEHAVPETNQSCLSQGESGVYREPLQRSATGSGAIMPRGTLVLGPFDHVEFMGSVGNGVRSVDPSYVAQGLLTPFVSVQSVDFGVAHARPVGETTYLSAKSVLFRTHADQDLAFNPTEGRSTLSTGSTRTGWAGSARVLGSFFDVSANATLVKATFDDTHLLVPYVPDLVLRADAALFHDLPWHLAHKPVRATLGYGVSYVGRRPLPYGDLSDIIFISDASLGFVWDIFTVRLSGQNLFDRRYKLGEYNYASSFGSAPSPSLVPERSFTAGAPRVLALSLAVTVGGA